MKPESKIFTSMVGGKPITFETGTLARQAGGAVTVRLGDTMIFAAATMSSPLIMRSACTPADVSPVRSSAVKVDLLR
jgi:polyribonucleotide nucleotidyltransferase